jgi:hypothetical protein
VLLPLFPWLLLLLVLLVLLLPTMAASCAAFGQAVLAINKST